MNFKFVFYSDSINELAMACEAAFNQNKSREIMKKLGIFLLLIALTACSEELEIIIPAKEPSLVVYSIIRPFAYSNTEQQYIKLQSTSHIFDTASNEICDAQVLYYENDLLKDTLSFSTNVQAYLISPNISDFPIEGNSYSIVVQKPGFKSVSANTFIPSQVKIIDTLVSPVAYFDEDGLVYSEIQFSFEDPAEEINYYEVAVSKLGASNADSGDFYELTTNDNLILSESYYPSLIRFDLDKPKNLLFSDKSINGKKHTLTMYYFPPQRESEKLYIGSHYLSIHLRNITEDYFKFKTTMIQHLNSKEEDILHGTGEPINVISNINNGFGLFSGYNEDIASLHIDSLIVSMK